MSDIANRESRPLTKKADDAPEATFLGRNLTVSESVAFLDGCDSDKSYLWKTHKGKTVGVTGTVHTAQWHTDKAEGLFAVIVVREKASDRKWLGCTANFDKSLSDQVLALRKGDVVTIRGPIQGVATAKGSVTLAFDDCNILSVEKNPGRTTANAADVAAKQVADKVRRDAEAKLDAERRAKNEAIREANRLQQDEDDAAVLLDLAKRTPVGSQRTKALQSLITKYPKSKAADEARKLLKTMGG